MITQPSSTALALLSGGFRLFFLGATLWMALAMVLWLAVLWGNLPFSLHFDPVSWHAHAFLFGFVSSVVAGFLLTAVPNWTGRPALTGLPLAALFGWWIVGRLVTTLADLAAPMLALFVDASFLVILAALVARELIKSGKLGNLIVVGAVALLAAANMVFHWQAMAGDAAFQGIGLRLGVSATLMLIMIVGGRIVPNFTRNWLKQRGARTMPAAAMEQFDQGVLLVSLAVLFVWTFAPHAAVTGPLLLILAALNAIRLARWRCWETTSEPLVAVLHVAYALIPLGACIIAFAMMFERPDLTRGAQHIWMVGAIGLMCLAVMTRASLGHSGQPLKAGVGTIAIYSMIIAALIARLAATVLPVQAPLLWNVSGGFWLLGFGLFIVLYGPLMLKARA